MSLAGTAEDKNQLETFDGSDPSLDRAWKRRAQLMIAGLPSTVGKIKHGARLMQHIKGEAELLLETLSVEDIIKEDVLRVSDQAGGELPTIPGEIRCGSPEVSGTIRRTATSRTWIHVDQETQVRSEGRINAADGHKWEHGNR